MAAASGTTVSPESTRSSQDAWQASLLDNLHPGAWINPRPSGRYNLVVLGAGTAGLVCAAGAAGLGAKVALVERHLMGGDCLNYGCVPSKALLRAARVAHLVRGAAAFGIDTGVDATVDFATVMERMRRLRAELAPHDSAERFRTLGVDVYFGDAAFADSQTVVAGGERLQFARAVIATGARAATPPIPGLREAGFLTNETVFSLTALPRHLLVVGSGPIGCELAQAFRRFGSRVTLLTSSARLLDGEGVGASDVLAARFEAEGIAVRTRVKILRVETGGGQKTLVVDENGREDRIRGDEILLGAGRAPNVEGLNLEAASVRFDAHGVAVDDHLCTSNKRIFAAGDICSRLKYTHAADAMARVVIQNALFFGRKRVSDLVIPRCTYTEPEVAQVGLSEDEARAKTIACRTVRVEMRELDRAVLDGETEGFVEVLAEAKSGRILGATLVGAHAGETIGEMVLAVGQRVALPAIAQTIHPYPTQGEILKRAGDAWMRTRLTPRALRLLTWISRMRR